MADDLIGYVVGVHYALEEGDTLRKIDEIAQRYHRIGFGQPICCSFATKEGCLENDERNVGLFLGEVLGLEGVTMVSVVAMRGD